MLKPSAYSPKFRADAVALVRSPKPRRSVADVAAQLGVNRETLRCWVRSAEARDANVRAGGLGAAEREELRRLCRWAGVPGQERQEIQPNSSVLVPRR